MLVSAALPLITCQNFAYRHCSQTFLATPAQPCHFQDVTLQCLQTFRRNNLTGASLRLCLEAKSDELPAPPPRSHRSKHGAFASKLLHRQKKQRETCGRSDNKERHSDMLEVRIRLRLCFRWCVFRGSCRCQKRLDDLAFDACVRMRRKLMDMVGYRKWME